MDILAQQIALEQEAVDLSQKKWLDDVLKARKDGEEADTDYGHEIVRRAILAASEAIAQRLAEMFSGRPGRPAEAARYLKTVNPEVAAFIGLRAAVDGVSSPRDLFAVAIDAGTRLEDQQKLAKFKADRPDLFNLTEDRLNRMSVDNRKRRRSVMTLMANRSGMEWEPWPKEARLKIGLMLLEAIKDATGIISFPLVATTRKGRHKTTYLLSSTDETVAFLKRAEESAFMLHPRYRPTIIPPREWTTPSDGGYWSGLLPLTMIKNLRGKALERLNVAQMPDVYAAINAMQNTAWKINEPVLAVLKEAVSRNITLGGLPPMADLPLPPKPVDIDTNPEALKGWKHAAANVHNVNQKQRSKRIQVMLTSSLAESYRERKAIYFPYQLDFRGRAYAVTMFLNPQGADYGKALLTFAEGKPINDHIAAGWLAIHGANTYGEDKAPFDNRIAWVEKNEEAILATAADPWATTEFWGAADKPWQFLAFCFEWAAFQAHGLGFISHLPVALDGSCNGLQHYSAALRDSVGGRATNLVPSEKPSDIYAEVAEECVSTVVPLVTAGADPGSPAWFAAKWIEFGVDRKIAKRAVMTLPYGSTIYSCREFIEEALRKKLDDGKPNPFRHTKRVEKSDGSVQIVETEGVFEASLFLQDHLWKAIGRVVRSAVQAMGWLKQTARLAAAEGKPILWTLPDGFIFKQAYPQVRGRRIEAILEGRVVTPLLHVDDDKKLDARRMANGIAPNFVHSLDASALRAYVNLAYENGVRSFGMVHDSYATVAADAEMMSACIRESFAELYEQNDVFDQFRQAIEATLSDKSKAKLPAPPPKGKLDIALVRQSDFFFA